MTTMRHREILQKVWVPLILVALVVTLGGGSYLLSTEWQLQTSTMLVYVVVVVGLYLFVGNSGVVSFGHIAFMGVGAYVAALTTMPTSAKHIFLPDLPGWLADIQVPPPAGVLLGGFAAVLLAVVVGPVLMRLSGTPAAFAMLALLVIVNVVIRESDSITRGSQTLIGVPLVTGQLMPLIAACGAIVAAFLYQRSASGMRLRATREDVVGAAGVGISLPMERTIALSISAFVVGCGGGLYAFVLGAISPDQFYLAATFTTIVMLVLGGMRSLTGAVLGTVVTFAISQLLRVVEAGVVLGPFTSPSLPGLQLIEIGRAHV